MKKSDEELKLEIAKELGLLSRIQESGWKSLSAKETGRIGGLLSRKRKSKAV
ncbi:MAG TPA: small, acid-soluble spore protein, alpha/beta type [Ruminiclostridium sp.]|nr:small, acid-soluble spore protein, alpha/beta type [Ruminiclostridium sp.]